MSTPKPALSTPRRQAIAGRYVRLEPLTPAHAGDLFAIASAPSADALFTHLFETPPTSLQQVAEWIEKQIALSDPLFFAVIDPQTGQCLGRQAFMRIVPEHGVIEIGSILWGPGMARSRRATEALYLFARHAFDTLGYRRLEWKCNSLNLPSRRAAERFGFTYEGTFRQHMIVKGLNRDTAWFAMLDSDWQRLRQGYERWLDAANFDAAGQQKAPLGFS